MPPITDQTPRRDVQIGGLVFKAPIPYAAGHTLNDNEAAAINQTYLENIGNNFRSKVLAAKRKAIVGGDNPTPEALKAVTEAQIKDFDAKLEAGTVTLDVSALQGELDTVVASYQMGVRRSSTVEVLDPVTKAARQIAKDRLKDALVKRGTKLNTVAAEWYTREIDKLLDKEHPKMKGDKNVTEDIWKTAERQVNLLKASAQEGLDDLDLDGISKPAAPATEGTQTGTDTTAPTAELGSAAVGQVASDDASANAQEQADNSPAPKTGRQNIKK